MAKVLLGGRKITVTDDHLHVVTGSTGTSHNRNIAAASTTYAAATNAVTWSTGLGIKELNLVARSTTTGADAYLLVVNAPSSDIADNWLSDAGSTAGDVQYWMIPTLRQYSLQFTDPISRVDVLPLGGSMRIVIGAN